MRNIYEFTRKFDIGERYKGTLASLRDSCIVEALCGGYSGLFILSSRENIRFIYPTTKDISIRPFFLKKIREARIKIDKEDLSSVKLRFCTQNSKKPNEEEIKKIKTIVVEKFLLN